MRDRYLDGRVATGVEDLPRGKSYDRHFAVEEQKPRSGQGAYIW
jgi:hypothetical protein